MSIMGPCWPISVSFGVGVHAVPFRRVESRSVSFRVHDGRTCPIQYPREPRKNKHDSLSPMFICPRRPQMLWRREGLTNRRTIRRFLQMRTGVFIAYSVSMTMLGFGGLSGAS